MTLIEEVPFASVLSEVIDNRGKTCPVEDSGMVLIATNCIKNHALYPVFEKVRYVSDETYHSWFRGHPRPGDLIFVTKGSPGRVAMVPDPVNFCIAQDMVALRANPKKVDPAYLFAVLRSKEVQNRIENMHVGTLIPHFKKGDFDKLLLPIPADRARQAFIGQTYLELSKKIDLNQRMNETLESIARELFLDWFVNYGPLERMAENQNDNNLFPKSFDSEGKPEGWCVQTIADCSERIQNGGTPSKSNNSYWSNGTVPWLTSGEVRKQVIVETEQFISEEGLKNSSAKWVPAGSTVVALYGATAGQVSLAAIELTTNQAICSLIPRPEYRYFNYVFLRSQSSNLLNQAVGSAQQNISKGIVEATKLVVPPAQTAKAFEEIVTPLFDLLISNSLESQRLSAVQDLILPRLISGQLDFKKGSGVVEDVL